MQGYVVEVYLPRTRARDARVTARRARAAAEELTGDGLLIRYLRTTFLLDDETCFHFFEASSVAPVAELCRRLDLGQVRIVEAVES